MIGGSRGIGFAVAERLQENSNLFIASRSEVDGIPNAIHLPYDATTDTLDISLLPDTLHGFVYCPGSINLKPFKMMSLDTFREEMELNFFGLVKTVQHIIPIMADGGSLVFFSTVAASKGMPFHTSIAASKGAIEGFAKSLAAEYAPRLRVNVVAPSLVNTPLAGRLLNNEKKKELMAQRHPLKRVGEAADIADLTVFLLSSQSTWMSGQVIGVDGGISNLHMN